MKKILLLRTAPISKKPNFFTDSDFFQQASEGLFDFFETTFDDLIISIGNNEFSIFDTKNNLDLSSYSKIFIRGSEDFSPIQDAAFAVSAYGEKHDIEIFAPYNETIFSKLAHAVRFYQLSIPAEKTFWLSKALVNNLSLAKGLHFPCVMKASFSSRGRYNYKVNNFKEVKKHFAAHPRRRFVLQNFFEGDGDYRLLFIGKEHLLISYANDPKTTYSKNATIGSGAKICPLSTLPKTAFSDAKKLAKSLDLEISGTDILVNHKTGTYTFLEINAFPGLTNDGDPNFEKLLAFRHLFKK